MDHEWHAPLDQNQSKRRDIPVREISIENCRLDGLCREYRQRCGNRIKRTQRKTVQMLDCIGKVEGNQCLMVGSSAAIDLGQFLSLKLRYGPLQPARPVGIPDGIFGKALFGLKGPAALGFDSETFNIHPTGLRPQR